VDSHEDDIDPTVKQHGLAGTIGKNLGFWTTFYLGFQTLGAIYGILQIHAQKTHIAGDIGTSPLYVFTGY